MKSYEVLLVVLLIFYGSIFPAGLVCANDDFGIAEYPSDDTRNVNIMSTSSPHASSGITTETLWAICGLVLAAAGAILAGLAVIFFLKKRRQAAF